jgi:hypothetical protein
VAIVAGGVVDFVTPTASVENRVAILALVFRVILAVIETRRSNQAACAGHLVPVGPIPVPVIAIGQNIPVRVVSIGSIAVLSVAVGRDIAVRMNIPIGHASTRLADIDVADKPRVTPATLKTGLPLAAALGADRIFTDQARPAGLISETRFPLPAQSLRPIATGEEKARQ